MTILMLTWEFPPYISGGLGVAVFGLAQSLAAQGHRVLIAGPRLKQDSSLPNCEFVEIPIGRFGYQILTAYSWSQSIQFRQHLPEIEAFAQAASIILGGKNFDIIHAHDWMTVPAGVTLKNQLSKPLVWHVHSTEFDRSREQPNWMIVNVEQQGLDKADSIVAVSEYTKKMLLDYYSVDPKKISIVHNGLPDFWFHQMDQSQPCIKREKIVVFLGRLTMQKGPDYFIKVAKRVLEVVPDAKFVIGGRGDMEGRLIEEAITQGIKPQLIFAGFLNESQVSDLFRRASVYVMPSVSEPFGISALEAMASGAPVIVSNNAGVTEIAKHILKVDFWDIDQMATKIISVLLYPEIIGQELQDNGLNEVRSFHWSYQTKKLVKKYWEVLQTPISTLVSR